MTDTNPTLGHNQGPPLVPEVPTAMKDEARERLDAFKEWEDLKRIETQEQVEHLTDLVAQMRATASKIEEARVEAKRPYDEGAKAVQSAFMPTIKALKDAIDRAKKMTDVFLRAKQAELDRLHKARVEAARAEELAAEEALTIAQASGDPVDVEEAEARMKEAEKALKALRVTPRAQARSASGGGRTLSQRKDWEVRVVNARHAFLGHYHDEPEVIAAIQKAALRDVRAAKGQITLSGIEFNETTRVA